MKESMFDLDNELIEEKQTHKNLCQEDLDRAAVLCITESFDEALEVYKQVLSKDYKCLDAYVGVLRAHSKDFTIYEGEQINKDILIVQKMMKQFGTKPSDDQYFAFVSAREEALEAAEKRKKEKLAEEAERRAEEDASIAKYGLPFDKNVKRLSRDYLYSLYYGKRKFPSPLKVVLPPWITSIGDDAFQHNSIVSELTIPGSVKEIADKTFAHSGLKKVVFESGVVSIGDRAFYECKELKEIVLPDTLKSIGDSAFAFCHRLVAIDLPASLSELGNGLFFSCSYLRRVKFNSQSPVSIPDRFFDGCGALQELEIPEPGIVGLGRSAFEGCYQLKGVKLAEGVSEIPASAFNECESLVSIRIPDSVAAIRTYAFWKCAHLETIHLGKGVKTLEENTIDSCANLKRIVFDCHPIPSPLWLNSLSTKRLTYEFHGTTAQFKQTVGSVPLPYGVSVTVVCSDGTYRDCKGSIDGK